MNGEKLLIIHMDDIGMNYACNEAAKDLFRKGIVTSASIMIPCAWAYDFIRWWGDNTQYDIGIHATLTCEWDACRWRPLSEKARALGLAGRDGFMHAGNEEVLSTAAPGEIYQELKAQMEQAIAWGLKPTHIDRHMYTVCICPEYFEQYIRIADEYRLPYQMCRKEYDAIDRLSEKVPVQKLDGMISSGEGSPPEGNPSLEGWDYETRKASLLRILGQMQPGLYQLTIHPVKDTPEIKEIIPEWRDRYLEYQLFLDDDVRKHMDRLGIRRVSWRDIISHIP